jgi:hypothetical protein
MSLDVTGIFEIESEAEKAVVQLVKDGFVNSNVRVSTQQKAIRTNKNYHYTSQDQDNGFVKFFDNVLAGHEESNPDKFIRPSELDTKVTVRVETTSEAERAANIMEIYGAINVNKKQGEFF